MTTDRKKKREITPHKGGRTARLDGRISPDIKELLKDMAKKEGVTIADLIERWVLEKTLK